MATPNDTSISSASDSGSIVLQKGSESNEDVGMVFPEDLMEVHLDWDEGSILSESISWDDYSLTLDKGQWETDLMEDVLDNQSLPQLPQPPIRSAAVPRVVRKSARINGARQVQQRPRASPAVNVLAKNKQNQRRSKFNKQRELCCNHCHKVFGSHSALALHLHAHTDNHKCADCGKCFESMSLLAIHRRKHTGVKPFQCPDCEKAFSQRGNMERHKRAQICSRRSTRS